MPSKNEENNLINKNELRITHADIVSMMNDEDNFGKEIEVSPNQVFELYIINQDGKEIFLKNIEINKTLSIQFIKNNLSKSDVTYQDIDVVEN